MILSTLKSWPGYKRNDIFGDYNQNIRAAIIQMLEERSLIVFEQTDFLLSGINVV